MVSKSFSAGQGAGRLAHRLGRLLLAFVVVAGLAACSSVYRNHGYVPPEEDLAQLQVGTDTRETAAQKVGRPSASGLLNDTGWFYVQSRWEQRGIRPAQEIDRQVVALTFSESGTLQNVERFGLERGQIVPLSRRVTETNVEGMGVLRRLFSNFGRLGAAQLVD
ncbi:MAG: outer membrane protein assembly factor BamE [Cypionkella sp.]|jgi:outer membrane protein assembly factor BamE (lipoprotein component of BamABCDE complex)|nr:outer membrane protein assembly factor BamE [Cypionkella sp.]